MGQCPLQCQPDRQTGRAEHRDDAGRLDTELRQHREHRDGEYGIARQAAEEAAQHDVEMRCAARDTCHRAIRPARQPYPDNQDRDRPQHTERMTNDQREQGTGIA
jgi:hypothetical protein